jgi:hypothetical protein
LFSTYYYSSGYSQTYTSFVDIDEIPGLFKYFDFIESKNSFPQKGIEYWFNSKDLSVMVYFVPATGKVADKWVYIIRADRLFANSSFYFDSTESFLEFANNLRSDYGKRAINPNE